MHVVGELQIRHSENRSMIEKIFMAFYAVIDLIQLTSILVFAAKLTRAFPNTFTQAEFWDPAEYNLSLLLQYKTSNCSYTVGDAATRAATGFSDIQAHFSDANVATLFSLHTERVRVAFAMVVAGFVISALNRVLMRANIFFIAVGPAKKLRLHKDIVTVLDLALTIAGLILTAACEPTADMLQAYLRDGCRLRRGDSVPFLDLAGLYVCASAVIVQYFVSIVAVLVIGLVFNRQAEPKTAEEKEREAEAEKAKKEEQEEKEKESSDNNNKNDGGKKSSSSKKDKYKKKDEDKENNVDSNRFSNNNINNGRSSNGGGPGGYQFYPTNPNVVVQSQNGGNAGPASSRALVPSSSSTATRNQQY